MAQQNTMYSHARAIGYNAQPQLKVTREFSRTFLLHSSAFGPVRTIVCLVPSPHARHSEAVFWPKNLSSTSPALQLVEN